MEWNKNELMYDVCNGEENGNWYLRLRHCGPWSGKTSLWSVEGRLEPRLNLDSSQIVVIVGFQGWLNLDSRTWIFELRFEQLLLEAELFEPQVRT